MTADPARQAILASIRRSLAASLPHDAVYAEIHSHHGPAPGSTGLALPMAPRPQEPGTEPAPASSGIPLFQLRLAAVGGRCIVVPDLAAARMEVTRILESAGARRVALSDAPLAREAIAGTTLPVEVLNSPALPDLFQCDAGVTAVQGGVAETGTLVIESARERNRLASLVPPLHIALLPAALMRETLGEILAELRGVTADLPSRSVILITGPSRTADIEQTLIMGVHGPQQLHVVIIDRLDPHAD